MEATSSAPFEGNYSGESSDAESSGKAAQRDFKIQREKTRGHIRPPGEAVDSGYVKVFIKYRSEEAVQRGKDEKKPGGAVEAAIIRMREVSAKKDTPASPSQKQCFHCTLL